MDRQLGLQRGTVQWRGDGRKGGRVEGWRDASAAAVAESVAT